jgi:hypothetical protein
MAGTAEDGKPYIVILAANTLRNFRRMFFLHNHTLRVCCIKRLNHANTNNKN